MITLKMPFVIQVVGLIGIFGILFWAKKGGLRGEPFMWKLTWFMLCILCLFMIIINSNCIFVNVYFLSFQKYLLLLVGICWHIGGYQSAKLEKEPIKRKRMQRRILWGGVAFALYIMIYWIITLKIAL